MKLQPSNFLLLITQYLKNNAHESCLEILDQLLKGVVFCLKSLCEGFRTEGFKSIMLPLCQVDEVNCVYFTPET